MAIIKVKTNGVWQEVAGISTHTHTTNDITNFPSSLPANGGNADTLDGKHANEFALASTVKTLQTSVANKADKPKMTSITMSASKWTGSSNPWSQTVSVNGVTVNSKVDLQPTAVQIVQMQNNDIAFIAENNNGTITVYAIGSKPTVDYTMHALITEVVTV